MKVINKISSDTDWTEPKETAVFMCFYFRMDLFRIGINKGSKKV